MRRILLAQHTLVEHVFILANILTDVNNVFNFEAIMIDFRSTLNLILRLAATKYHFYKMDNLLLRL